MADRDKSASRKARSISKSRKNPSKRPPKKREKSLPRHHKRKNSRKKQDRYHNGSAYDDNYNYRNNDDQYDCYSNYSGRKPEVFQHEFSQLEQECWNLRTENERLKAALTNVKCFPSNINEPPIDIIFRNRDLASRFENEVQNFLASLLSDERGFNQIQQLPTPYGIDFESPVAANENFRTPLSSQGSSQFPQANATSVPDVLSNQTEFETSDILGETSTNNVPLPKKVSCFNCGGPHVISCCTEIPLAKRPKRSPFQAPFKQERYHTPNPFDSPNGNYKKGEPGVISKELSKALDMHRNQVPFHIYRMRVLGYPPGWMEETKKTEIEFCGLLSKEDCDKKDKKEKCDPEKIIKYPGFNVPLEPKYIDEGQEMGYPPFRLNQMQSVMEEFKPKDSLSSFPGTDVSMMVNCSNLNPEDMDLDVPQEGDVPLIDLASPSPPLQNVPSIYSPMSPSYSALSQSYDNETHANNSNCEPYHSPTSPSYTPTGYSYSPTATSYSPASSFSSPISPSYRPKTPTYGPVSPSYNPKTPTYSSIPPVDIPLPPTDVPKTDSNSPPPENSSTSESPLPTETSVQLSLLNDASCESSTSLTDKLADDCSPQTVSELNDSSTDRTQSPSLNELEAEKKLLIMELYKANDYECVDVVATDEEDDNSCSTEKPTNAQSLNKNKVLYHTSGTPAFPRNFTIFKDLPSSSLFKSDYEELIPPEEVPATGRFKKMKEILKGFRDDND